MKFFIKTLGCRVNQAESLVLVKKLLEKSFRHGLPPDVCILNTCAVTQKAEKETKQEARRLKREYPGAFLIVTGCAVDYWHVKGKLPNLGADLYLENNKKMSIPNLPEVSIGLHFGGVALPTPRVFVKVQDGCNQFCSYCIVPFLRGRSRSVPAVEIVREIKKLEEKGTQEIILCGINLADYKPNLAVLLKKILKNTKIPRIRLGSINLEAFNNNFISLWANPRLCPHFHIPLQSGCDKSLRRMKRDYTFSQFKNKIDKLRQLSQIVNITTDILVGFPGETKGEFEESLRNLASLPISKIHVFRYSLREGTWAVAMTGQVAEKVKSQRAAKIRQLSQKMSRAFNHRFVGRKLKVLFERREEDYCQGWSENYLAVRVKDEGLSGQIKVVRIEKQSGDYLNGVPINKR